MTLLDLLRAAEGEAFALWSARRDPADRTVYEATRDARVYAEIRARAEEIEASADGGEWEIAGTTSNNDCDANRLAS